MTIPTTVRRAVIAMLASTMLPFSVAAHPASDGEAENPPPLLDGVVWLEEISLSGPEIEATLDEDEISAWTNTVGVADATLDELEYTYLAAFDTTRLPSAGGLATIRLAGTDEASVREAAIADIVAQAEIRGEVSPAIEAATIAGKDVMMIDLPESMGFSKAIVYAHGDTAWVVVMREDAHLEAVLEQLP